MNQTDMKLTEFKQKQVEVLKLKAVVQPQVDAIIAEFKTKSEALQKEYQEKVNEIELQWKNEMAKYQAELKAWSGITDGETINVLQTLEAIVKIAREATQ